MKHNQPTDISGAFVGVMDQLTDQSAAVAMNVPFESPAGSLPLTHLASPLLCNTLSSLIPLLCSHCDCECVSETPTTDKCHLFFTALFSVELCSKHASRNLCDVSSIDGTLFHYSYFVSNFPKCGEY